MCVDNEVAYLDDDILKLRQELNMRQDYDDGMEINVNNIKM